VMASNIPTGLARPSLVAGVVVVALVVHMALWRLVLRYMKDRTLSRDLYERCRWSARVVVVFVALLLALELVFPDSPALDTALHILVLLLVFAGAWLATTLVTVAQSALMRRYDIDVPDNLRARRLHTQVRVLGRLMVVVIVVVAVSIGLLTLPQGRAIGAGLLASAGIAGVVASVAARSTLGNLVAGLQIAFAEPIRLDDVVVIEDEWGNVEEITLTYVIVRLWDRRRLVLPTSYFVEHPIQNWTRYSADIVGSVHLYLDYATPVDEVRAELGRILADSRLWDGQVAVLQVIDTTESTMLVRALVSASTAPRTFDLRCEVRERLLAWLQQRHPYALPRLRAEVEAAGPPQPGSPQRDGAVPEMRHPADPPD
jgi:small-conductance mechanosensitive channel